MITRFFECFFVALKLGLTSFGGPVAHLGFFQKEYVEKRKWISESVFHELLALCQLLPGPASSQLGAAIGRERGGWAGLIAAWLGFTLPSALVMGLLGVFWADFSGEWVSGAALGLGAVTLAVVTLATYQLGRTLCPSVSTAALAVVSALLMIVFPYPLMQIGVILLGGLFGARYLKGSSAGESGEASGSRGVGMVCGVIFLLLLGVSFFVIGGAFGELMAAIYQAGALVFGGGHVVMPLLETGVVETGLIHEETFLAGYGATQAVPGPVFTFGAFIGGAGGGWVGAVCGTIAIFLPGLLLLSAMLPQRAWLRKQAWAPGAVAGAGAAVVGLLAAVVFGLLKGSFSLTSWPLWVAVGCAIILYKKWVPVWALVLLVSGLGVILGNS